MKSRVVKRPSLSFWERWYLGTVVKGLGETLKHFFGVCKDLFNWQNKTTAITIEIDVVVEVRYFNALFARPTWRSGLRR